MKKYNIDASPSSPVPKLNQQKYKVKKQFIQSDDGTDSLDGKHDISTPRKLQVTHDHAHRTDRRDTEYRDARISSKRNNTPIDRDILIDAVVQALHPKSVTVPPLNRGTMPKKKWTGFWSGLRDMLYREPTPDPIGDIEPLQASTRRRRLVLPLATILGTILASKTLAKMDKIVVRNPVIRALNLLFLGWGVVRFLKALVGMYVLLFGDNTVLSIKDIEGHSLAPEVRTAVVMAICQEDIHTVFAGLRAICESLHATGLGRQFDVFVLSDSIDPAIQSAERLAYEEMRADLSRSGQDVNVYYRLRKNRRDKKAGNVADFCRRWGRNYRYMVVLDADSVMSGECILNMTMLMEANHRVGILQSHIQIIGRNTPYARAEQFASHVIGRLFTAGTNYFQMGESNYNGHNAIIRVEPFMKHCGLAHLRGRGGLSGGILSHDVVEAALMRRAGYRVCLVTDLVGSYEQCPHNLLANLQRDRRWCHGNIQHLRLIAEPGLHYMNRFSFGTSAMNYMASPIWLGLMSVMPLLVGGNSPHARVLPTKLGGPWPWTLSLFFLPRLMGLATVFLRNEQALFGGSAKLLVSAILESIMAVLHAPVSMIAHSVFVLSSLTGTRMDWISPPRNAETLRWMDVCARIGPVSVVAALLALALANVDARLLLSLIPVGLPLLLAVPVSVMGSHVELGKVLQKQGLLLIPEELRTPPVLRQSSRHERLSRQKARASTLAITGDLKDLKSSDQSA